MHPITCRQLKKAGYKVLMTLWLGMIEAENLNLIFQQRSMIGLQISEITKDMFNQIYLSTRY